MQPFSIMVSVVVPTHNRKELLSETLRSILHQTFRDFELIVVSDGSTDGTDEMVSSIADTRVRLIRQEKSGQPAKPRNTGIREARGKYVALCDDDDIWVQDKLAIQVDAMEHNGEVGLCYTNGQVLRNGVLGERPLNRRKIFNNHFYELLKGNVIPNSSVLIRRSVFDRVGFINTDPVWRGIEDYEFWLRVAHEFPLLYIDQPLIQYRVHSNNITFSRSLETRRAIGVVRHVGRLFGISYGLLPTLVIQYAKYWTYKLLLK
ncbi:MAG: glycosyltransferase [Nitrosomonadales bacterium]|nr:glycosyltransferase [Nitrosomonadales bacterium]